MVFMLPKVFFNKLFNKVRVNPHPNVAELKDIQNLIYYNSVLFRNNNEIELTSSC